MSDLTRQQYLGTWDRLCKAVEGTGVACSADEERAALQDVVSLCDALKASAIGHSASIGYRKRVASGRGAAP